MIRYPLDYDPITEYWELIKADKIVVSDKIRKTYKKIKKDLDCTTGKYCYSHARANHVIEFIENFCRHSKGKMGGKPVVLELWEKALLATIFGFVDEHGNRKYKEAILIVGKKNGKSLLASCVGLYLQVGDGEPGPEVYAVATKKDQAKIIWTEAKRMVNKSPVLKKRIKGLVNEMRSSFNDGVFKAVASDVDSLDGLNCSGILMDEIHQWKNGRALYNIMADGTSAREQPLVFITSTAGTIREDLYDQKYDEATQIINGYFDNEGIKNERFIAFIYELDNRKEWTDPKCWKKANPGLGTIKKYETLKEKVDNAKVNSMLVKNLVCKEFNIRETSSEAWLIFDDLNNTATFDVAELKPRYCIGGLDLSTTTDLCCATVIFRVPLDETLYVLQMYWLPGNLIEQREREDNIPYTRWVERGLMRTSGTNKIDYKDVTAWFMEVQNKLDIYIYKIGYDAWNSQYIIDDLESFFGKNSTDKVVQGKKTMSGPMKSFASDLKAKKINYNNNSILKWNLANAAIDVDKNDNISLCKTSNSRKRIDGVASLMDAFVVYERHYDEYMSMI
ncbi:MAG: terminase large subunit [Sphaerochaetaceae bacterium]|nr:terminase large subunit [Sphaerochaetaceae bacterium]